MKLLLSQNNSKNINILLHFDHLDLNCIDIYFRELNIFSVMKTTINKTTTNKASSTEFFLYIAIMNIFKGYFLHNISAMFEVNDRPNLRPGPVISTLHAYRRPVFHPHTSPASHQVSDNKCVTSKI